MMQDGGSMGGRLLVLGLGGAGGRMVDAVARDSGAAAVRTAAVDTDAAALEESNAATRVLVETARRGGARRLETAARDKLRVLLDRTELLVAVSGLGGASGADLTALALDLAREQDVPAIWIGTHPFRFEGQERADAARTALAAVRAAADATILVPADALCRAVGADEVAAAFPAAAAAMGMTVRCLWQVLAEPAYLKINLSDVLQLAGPGTLMTTQAWGEAEGRRAAERALAGLLESPLLQDAYGGPATRAGLVHVVGGSDLTLSELGLIMDGLTAALPPGAALRAGTSVSPHWKGRVSITALLARPYAALLQGASALPAVTGTERPELPAGDGQEETGPGGRNPEQLTIPIFTGPTGRGRFGTNGKPNVLDGEDLDIPTFVRRGLRFD